MTAIWCRFKITPH